MYMDLETVDKDESVNHCTTYTTIFSLLDRVLHPPIGEAGSPFRHPLVMPGSCPIRHATRYSIH